MDGFSAPLDVRQGPARERLSVCFPFLAQLHQLPHSLPIALELASRYPDIEVAVAATSLEVLRFIRDFAAEYPAAQLRYDLLQLPILRGDFSSVLLRLSRKLATLAFNCRYFNTFSAIVAPERTTLLLKRAGVLKPKYIWTKHGAGDRRAGFARDVAACDLVLLPGSKTEQRMHDLGVLREGAYVTGVYAKFDYVLHALKGRRVFVNGRPTVLYNPHSARRYSSWPAMGWQVLDFFAQHPEYNLIFAPHMKLFHPATPAKQVAFADYAARPNIHIDLGSPALIDMSYTTGADIYLGDVSSQLAEFLVQPRPCVFLNPMRRNWRDDVNFRNWALGEVIEDIGELEVAFRRAMRREPERASAQEAYAEETFDGGLRLTAHVGADAVADFLHRTAAA